MRQISPKLAPWLAAFNQQVARLIENGFKPTAISAREALAFITASNVKPGPVIAWANDELIPGRDYTVPVRIYHPAPQQALPVIVYFHGGGGMAGSVSVYDPICRRIAAASQHIVVSVEYRLAPENPYPAGLQDALTAAKGVWDALERRQLPYQRTLTLAGDSGGGALAASVSHLAQFDASLPVAAQVLIYPSLDYTMEQPSMSENGEGYFLTRARIAWYFDNYFQHAEDRRSASPLYGEFTSKLPRTLMISAGFDPLRDEAAAYVEKLQQAGIPHRHLYFDDMLHAILNLEALVETECQAIYRGIAEFLTE
jgi:acetyl esterase/lipase